MFVMSSSVSDWLQYSMQVCIDLINLWKVGIIKNVKFTECTVVLWLVMVILMICRYGAQRTHLTSWTTFRWKARQTSLRSVLLNIRNLAWWVVPLQWHRPVRVETLTLMLTSRRALFCVVKIQCCWWTIEIDVTSHDSPVFMCTWFVYLRWLYSFSSQLISLGAVSGGSQLISLGAVCGGSTVSRHSWYL